MLSLMRRLFSKDRSIKLNVLVYKEDDEWIAHCLQMDIVTTNETRESVEEDIIDLIKTHIIYAIKNENIGNLFKFAPPEEWEKYFSSTVRKCDVRKIDIQLPKRDHNTAPNPVNEVEFCLAAA